MKHALATMKISDPPAHTGPNWFTDTAATHHVTNDPQHLLSAVPYEGSDSVIVGNGDFLPITHIGSIPLPGISGNLHLKASWQSSSLHLSMCLWMCLLSLSETIC